MKKFNGYDEAKKAAQSTGSAKLPAGGYVVKVMAVKFTEGTNGNSDMIAVQFDVSEGEQKDFFRKQYEANTSEDKKWKGVARIYLPSDDGSEKDSWTKKAFARWTSSFEESNKGYTWDWDESKWKGKTIGLVFREAGTVIDGKAIEYTEVSAPVPADQVREGTFWDGFLKFKAKGDYEKVKKNGGSSSAGSSDGFSNIPVGVDEEIPFD